MKYYPNLRQLEIISPDNPRYKMLGLDKNEEYQRYVEQAKGRNRYDISNAIEEAHQQARRLYEEREARARREEAEKKFRKELEKKVIQQVKETTEKEISKLFK